MSVREIVPSVNTPVRAIEESTMAAWSGWLSICLPQGAHGLGPFANTSEGSTLTGERTALMWQIVRQVKGLVPLVASCREPSSS